MNKGKVVIAGASGFVGCYLIEALIKEGYHIVALSRRDRSKDNSESLTWVTCDLFSREDTRRALEGCEIAFYLTHSMIPSARLSQGNFADYDIVLADNFSRAAKEHNLKQIIYLGGIIPEHYSLSRHLLSRLEVERTLKASGVPLTSLRAGIILGPEGSSFRIMYNLVTRLPVMVCPSWTGTLSNPISIWDMVKALVFCTGNLDTYKKYFDVGGQTTLSYLEMMRVLGQKLHKKRLLVIVPFFSPGLSKLWVTKVTGAPKDLVYPLIGSLKTHMVPNVHRTIPPQHFRPPTYDEAIDRILSESQSLDKIPSAFQYGGSGDENDVRSIQRLETLYRFNAEDVSNLYFAWLGSVFPFLTIHERSNHISINLRNMARPLLALEKCVQSSSPAYCVFYIRDGLLSKGRGQGSLIFRTIIDGRNTMVEIHGFVPRLPWFIYKYTQAIIHVITMKMFNRYLLQLQRNSSSENGNSVRDGT